MATAVERETRVFYTTSQNLKLIREPAVTAVTALGQVQTLQDEVSCDFAPDGRFLTDDPGMVEWLRAHPLHGVRFVEDGREPGRLLPTEEDFGAEVVEAAADLDSQRLRGLLDEERNAHARPQLIALVEGALRKVEGLEASPTAGDGS